MRARLPWILLAVSLAANVFFGVGVGYSLYKGESPIDPSDGPIDAVAEPLGLDTVQREGLMALRRSAHERRAAMRASGDRFRADLLAELGKPHFDRQRFVVLMETRSAQRREMFADLARDLHAYLATLAPEQREQFLDMARERGFLRRLFGGPPRPGPAHPPEGRPPQ